MVPRIACRIRSSHAGAVCCALRALPSVPAPSWQLCLAVLAVTGCGNSTNVNVSGPSITRCGVSITGSSSPAPAAGGTGTLTVSTARECAWSARSESSWIALSSTEGQGPASLGYSILPNPNGTLRRGTVAVEDQRVEIAQEPAPCRYDVSPVSVDVGASSGAVELNLVAPGGCGWTIRPSDTWLSPEPSSGAGATTVRLVVAPNPGPARTGNVSIGDTTVAVRQAGNSTAPSHHHHHHHHLLLRRPPGCTYQSSRSGIDARVRGDVGVDHDGAARVCMDGYQRRVMDHGDGGW